MPSDKRTITHYLRFAQAAMPTATPNRLPVNLELEK